MSGGGAQAGGFLPGEFTLGAQDFAFHGHAFNRPECVVALSDGSVLASNKEALVSVVRPDGSEAALGHGASLANTFALEDDGSVLIADLKRGSILKAGADGEAKLLFDSFEGEPLGSVNYVLAGEEPGTCWFSVSTRSADYRTAISEPKPDGRIFRIDANGLSLAADGLYFPNAMEFDPASGYLYIVETTAGAISRAQVDASGRLGKFSRFGPSLLYPGAYPDGLALDEEGNVWITELSRHAILVIDPSGRMHTVFEDPGASVIRAPTALAFGGHDRRTVFVGSLKMTSLASFRAPVAGRLSRHWLNGSRPSFL